MNRPSFVCHSGVAKRSIHILFGAVLAVLVAGCVTRTEVASIVAESNQALLAAQATALAEYNGSVIASQLGGLPPASGKVDEIDPWSQASSRIDSFAEAHPEQKKAIAALRIRQAILLLSNQQYPLAKMAFDLAPMEDLVAERDQALKRNQAHLIWWFDASAADHWTDDSDQPKATAALDALKVEQQTLSSGSEIRDYLAELRAWIGLTRARHASSGPERKAHLEEAMNIYATLFTAEDILSLKSSSDALPDPQAISLNTRRRLRAQAVINAAKELNQRPPKADLENKDFEALIR